MQGMQFQSLVEELGSHMLCGEAKKFKKTNKQTKKRMKENDSAQEEPSLGVLVVILLLLSWVKITSKFLRNLYAGQEATVRIEYGTTDRFQIGKAVSQGCIMSSYLFNLYAVHHKKCWAGGSTSWNQDCQEKYQ